MNSCHLEAPGQAQVECFDAERLSDNKDSISKPSHFSFGLDFPQPVEQFSSLFEGHVGYSAAKDQPRPPVRRSQSEIWRDEHQPKFMRLTSEKTVANRHGRNLSLGDRENEHSKSGLQSSTSNLQDFVPICSSNSHPKPQNIYNLEEIALIFEKESCGSETPKWALAPSRRGKDEHQKNKTFSIVLEDLALDSQGRGQTQQSISSITEAPKSDHEIDGTKADSHPEPRAAQPHSSQTDGQLMLISEELSLEEATSSPVAAERHLNKSLRSPLLDRYGSLPNREPISEPDPAGEQQAVDLPSNLSRVTKASVEKKAGSSVGTPSTKHSQSVNNKRAPVFASPPKSPKDARIIMVLALFALFLLFFELV
jgi:hypothetical protein